MIMTSRVSLALIILGINVTGCGIKPFAGMHSVEIRTEVSLEIIEHAVEAMVEYVPREETFLSVVEVWEKTPISYRPDQFYSAIECHLVEVVVTLDLSSMTIDSIGTDSIRITLQSPELRVSGTHRTIHNAVLCNDYEADQISRLSSNVDVEVNSFFTNKEENAEIVTEGKGMTETLLRGLIGSLYEGIYILFIWE